MTSVKSGGARSVILFVALIVLPPLHQGDRTPLLAPCQPPRKDVGPDQGPSICHRGHGTTGQPRPAPRQKGEKAPTETPPSGAEKGTHPEIKVVTFNQGRFDPPILEPFRFWPRGHTAVIIGGEVHSFEADWQCGETEAEYKRDNAWRGAWVQVLDLPKPDAKQIQRNFNRSCGTGAFLLTGVCTSSAGRLLQNVLTDLKVTWAPMRLRAQLGRRGYVARTYRWHREVWTDKFAQCLRGEDTTQDDLQGPHPSKGPSGTAHDKCLRQLGLSEEDISPLLGSIPHVARSTPPKRPLYDQGRPVRPKSTATTRGRVHSPSNNLK